jgi:hypothetical protein
MDKKLMGRDGFMALKLDMSDKRRMLHIQAPLLAYVNSLALLFV